MLDIGNPKTVFNADFVYAHETVVSFTLPHMIPAHPV